MAIVPAALRSNSFTVSPAGTGPFDIGFRLFDDDDIKVFVDGVETSAFTIQSSYSDGYDDEATITFNATQSDGAEVVIDTWISPSRSEDYVAGDPDLTRKLNVELARLWSAYGDMHRETNRALRLLSASTPLIPSEAPSYIGFSAGMLALFSSVEVTEATVSAFMETVLDDPDGDSALGTLGGSSIGISLFKAADVAAVLSALSLGDLAVLDAVGADEIESDAVTTAKILNGAVTVTKILSADRPDNDDLSVDGAKLALRKNVKAAVEAGQPWELVETIATTSGTTFTVPSSGAFEDGYDVVLEFVEVEHDAGANRRMAFDLYGATDGAYTGSPQSMSEEVNASGYFGLLKLPPLLRSAANAHPLIWAPSTSAASGANFVDAPNQYERNFVFGTAQKIDRIRASLNGTGNFDNGAVRYWRKRS